MVQGLIRSVCLAISAVATACLLAGCSSGGGIPGTAPVTGKVTYNGQPVDGASISFIGQAETQRPAGALSGPDGAYALKTGDTDGALPGNYTVLVTKTDAPAAGEMTMEAASKSGPAAPPKSLIPAKYGDPLQSPLKFEVKSGPNAIDLPLTD